MTPAQPGQLHRAAPRPDDSVGTSAEYVLTLDCAEAPGIVHAVTGFLLHHGYDIVDNKQFGDQRRGHFFMRVHVTTDLAADAVGRTVERTGEQFRTDFLPLAERFGMRWHLHRQDELRRVLIMVSKFGHCLNDLLIRADSGELPIKVVAVVSNHRDHEALAEWHGIPFFHIPVTADTKHVAEERLLKLVDELDVELVILARYMQVLSDQLATELSGRTINIHHSFLPSFKGAKPYHQAYERGVKTIGATAHYVDSELDEGPIISQQVVEVDHTYGPEELVAAGRDTECKALSNAVKWHCQGRVILQDGRTVVLN